MIITKLEAENVKRLKAISITPDGNSVIIGGDNAQGKSSTLDSILMALKGKRAFEEKPVREGELEANISLELSGDFLVKRKIKPDGKHELIVTHKDGTKYDRPQKLLDEMVSKVSFDPLDFERMQPFEQRTLLLKLVGREEEIEAVKLEREKFKEEKLIAYREKQGIISRLAELPYDPEIREARSNVEVLRKLDQAKQGEVHRAQTVAKVAELKRLGNSHVDRLEELEAEVARVKAAITDTKRLLDETQAYLGTLGPEVDPSIFEQELAEVEAHNAKWRINEEHTRIRHELDAAEKREQRALADLEAVEKRKVEIINSATFPVPGLSITDEGVLYNGIPFQQASQAERLRISTAIGLTLNPQLKILLIRDGSRLDENNLRAVAEMAAAAEAQVWIERVSKGAECSVIIEDGEIKQ